MEVIKELTYTYWFRSRNFLQKSFSN